MKFEKILPHPKLMENIRYYWKISIENKDLFKESRLIPGIESDLIVQQGGKTLFRFDDQPWENRNENVFIEGSFSKPFIIQFTTPAIIFGVRFTTLGLQPFAKESLWDLRNYFASADHVFKHRITDLTDQLFAAHHIVQIQEIFDHFFLKILHKSPEIDHLTKRIVSEIKNGSYNLTSPFLLKNTRCSNRKLQIDFKFFTGMTMKHYSRVHRIRQAIYMMHNNEWIRLKDIGYSLGYYDQSHFINDFKSMTGVSPGDYLSNTGLLHKIIVGGELEYNQNHHNRSSIGQKWNR